MPQPQQHHQTGTHRGHSKSSYRMQNSKSASLQTPRHSEPHISSSGHARSGQKDREGSTH